MFFTLPPICYDIKVIPNDTNIILDDYIAYEMDKKLRNTERGLQAIKDNEGGYNIEYLFNMFSKPFGKTISKENTPELYTLLSEVFKNEEKCHYKNSKYLFRPRPYVVMEENTPLGQIEENRLKDISSYPSGHTALGWSFALILAEINPTNRESIYTVGYEFGESRKIIGFHWASDIQKTRLLATMYVNNLHTSKEFLEQLNKAKKEYLNLKK